jgi:hypothetical protein
MNNSNHIDRIDEVLRLYYLDSLNSKQSEEISVELYKVIENNNSVISPLKREALILKLTGLLQQVTLGHLISEAMHEKNFDENLLAYKTGLSSNLISDIRKDAMYPNNIPIQLLKKLVLSLELSYEKVKAAILRTFEGLKRDVQLGDPRALNLSPSFRKGEETSGLKKIENLKEGEGNELFENEQALNKYLNRLQELMSE